MASLSEQYKAICAELKAKPNSAVVKQLADVADASTFTAWDLSTNVVGTKGATAVAVLAKTAMPSLEELNLAGNNLTSPVTEELYKNLVDHPALRKLDLSDNDIRLGGPALVELVKKNKRLTDVNVNKTFLRPLFERLVGINVKNNADAAATKPASNKEKKTTRFTFGEAAETDTAFAEAEDEAFGNFGKFSDEHADGHVSFAAGSNGGKKVIRRPTVCSEVYTEDDIDKFVPQVIEKPDKVRQWIFQVLERHDLFSHLEDFELYTAVDAMQDAERSEGDTIFCEGDEDGDLFYLIGSGEVELSVEDEPIKTLKKGDTTQDLMLLYTGEYKETAKCLTDAVVYSLDRQTYRCILSKASKKKRAMYEGFLHGVEKFQVLTKHELLQLADALKPAVYEDGQKLIKYGDDGLTFFLLVEGVVEVYGRDDKKEPVKVCEFKAGDCVGELEFLNDHKCVADVVAKGHLRTAKMNRHHFEMVMGPVKELLARTANESEVYSYYRDQLRKMDEDKKDDEVKPAE